MCSDYVEEKTGLINALIKDRKLSDLPKISQVIYHPFNISEFYMKFIHKRWFSLPYLPLHQPVGETAMP